MITIDPYNKAIKEAILPRLKGSDRTLDLDVHLAEFEDVLYRIQVSAENPDNLLLSVQIPEAPPEVKFLNGLPEGALDSVRQHYGPNVKILEEPVEGFRLTLSLDLLSIDKSEESLQKTASELSRIRSIVLTAPLRKIFSSFREGNLGDGVEKLSAIMYGPKRRFFVYPHKDKVMIIFPMKFKDENDVVLGNSFLQELTETGRMSSFSGSPLCFYSPSPPLELSSSTSIKVEENAGYVTFGLFPQHLEGEKLDSSLWMLLTFPDYVNYHVKSSKAFMHTRMRRRVDGLIQVINKAKPDSIQEHSKLLLS